METVKKPLSILVADDCRATNKYISEILKNVGHEVFSAFDGQTAYEMACREKPQVLFLDVIMPEMDGRDICKALKSQPETADMQIIMTTGMHSDFDKELYRELGCDDILEKGHNINKTTIQHFLAKAVWRMHKKSSQAQ